MTHILSLSYTHKHVNPCHTYVQTQTYCHAYTHTHICSLSFTHTSAYVIHMSKHKHTVMHTHILINPCHTYVQTQTYCQAYTHTHTLFLFGFGKPCKKKFKTELYKMSQVRHHNAENNAEVWRNGKELKYCSTDHSNMDHNKPLLMRRRRHWGRRRKLKRGLTNAPTRHKSNNNFLSMHACMCRRSSHIHKPMPLQDQPALLHKNATPILEHVCVCLCLCESVCARLVCVSVFVCVCLGLRVSVPESVCMSVHMSVCDWVISWGKERSCAWFYFSFVTTSIWPWSEGRTWSILAPYWLWPERWS